LELKCNIDVLKRNQLTAGQSYRNAFCCSLFCLRLFPYANFTSVLLYVLHFLLLHFPVHSRGLCGHCCNCLQYCEVFAMTCAVMFHFASSLSLVFLFSSTTTFADIILLTLLCETLNKVAWPLKWSIYTSVVVSPRIIVCLCPVPLFWLLYCNF